MSGRRARVARNAAIRVPRCRFMLPSGRRCALGDDHGGPCAKINDDPRCILVGPVAILYRIDNATAQPAPGYMTIPARVIGRPEGAS